MPNETLTKYPAELDAFKDTYVDYRTVWIGIEDGMTYAELTNSEVEIIHAAHIEIDAVQKFIDSRLVDVPDNTKKVKVTLGEQLQSVLDVLEPPKK